MHVFVSYSREDSEAALQFVSDLQRQNVSVWLDQKSQRGGDDWIEAIQTAIDSCSHFVLLMSPSSISSNIVRDEWTYAKKVGVPIVPVMLRRCEPPFPLHTMNWLDLERDYDRGIKEVIRALDEPDGVQNNSQRQGHWYQWLGNKLRSFGHLTKRTVVSLTGMAVLIVLGYFGYDLMKDVVSPCETIYEQTATRLGTKVEFLQAKGEIHIGKKQLQILPQAAQVTALNLKTCCIVLDEGKLDAEQFLQCRTAAQNYESAIDLGVKKVEEIAKLQRSNETEAYTRAVKEFSKTLENADKASTSFGQQISNIVASQAANKSDGNASLPNSIVADQADRNTSPPVKTDSHGTEGVNGTISFIWEGPTSNFWYVLQADQYGEYKQVESTKHLRRGERQVVELAPGDYRVAMHWNRGFKAQDIRVEVGKDVAIQPMYGTVTFQWEGPTSNFWYVLQADQYGEYKQVESTKHLRRGERQVVELAPGDYRVAMHWNRGFKAQDIRVEVGKDVAIQPMYGTVTFQWEGPTSNFWYVLQADQYGEYKQVESTKHLRRGERQVVELAPGDYRIKRNAEGATGQDVTVHIGKDVLITE